MSILIKGMEMPKGCGDCRFFAWSRGVGQHCAVAPSITFHPTIDGMDVKYERNGDCPLIPIPPHGRLIDADAAIRNGWVISRTYAASATENVYEVKAIDALPIIIEAEGEER